MKSVILITLAQLVIHTSSSFAQTCNTAIPQTSPNSRYFMRTDGTAFDKQTSLTWMRCAMGQKWNGHTCQDSRALFLSWQSALQTAERTTFAGKSDWRLPNEKELLSLVERQCYDPAINLAAFPKGNNAYDTAYWSSTTSVGFGTWYAWIMDFYEGFNSDGGNKSEGNFGNGYAVRLVRGDG